MNDQPVHRDDITALRREGDLGKFMQDLRAEGRSRLAGQSGTKSRRDRRRWGAIPIPPDHKPGQWPPGTSPPGPPPERDLPARDWDDAVQRHRTEQRRQLDEEDQ